MMDNGQHDETPNEFESYDQREFLLTVRRLARIAAAQHAAASGSDAVTPDVILSDLCANMMTAALIGDPSGRLMVALTMKAEQQASVILQNRADRIADEMEVVARVNGGWKKT